MQRSLLVPVALVSLLAVTGAVWFAWQGRPPARPESGAGAAADSRGGVPQLLLILG